MNENILNYIRQSRGIYTDEAITQELLRAGHSTAEIEAAWNIVRTGSDTSVVPDQSEKSRSEGQPPAEPRSVQRPTPTQPDERNQHLIAGLYMLGLIAIPFVASSLYLTWLTIPLLIVALGGGIAAVIAFRERDPVLSRALTRTLQFFLVLFVVIPFVIIVIILGICVVTGTKIG